MESYPWLTNENLFQCQHNNRGYCKFGDKCRYRHFTKICTNRICKLKECRFRHPRSCRNRENCKFFKRNVCLYKHIKQDYPEKYTRYEEEINKVKVEINRLKELLKYTDTFLTNKIEEIREKNDSKIKELKKENQNLKTINESMSVKVNKQKIEDQNKTFPCNKCNFTFESKIFTDFDNLDNHQSNYIRCEKCAVCYHNEFEYNKHENCKD